MDETSKRTKKYPGADAGESAPQRATRRLGVQGWHGSAFACSAEHARPSVGIEQVEGVLLEDVAEAAAQLLQRHLFLVDAGTLRLVGLAVLSAERLQAIDDVLMCDVGHGSAAPVQVLEVARERLADARVRIGEFRRDIGTCLCLRGVNRAPPFAADAPRLVAINSDERGAAENEAEQHGGERVHGSAFAGGAQRPMLQPEYLRLADQFAGSGVDTSYSLNLHDRPFARVQRQGDARHSRGIGDAERMADREVHVAQFHLRPLGSRLLGHGRRAVGADAEKLGVLELHLCRNPARAPVVDALHAAGVLCIAKKLGELRRPPEVVDEFGVVHDAALNTPFKQMSTPRLSTSRLVAGKSDLMHPSFLRLFNFAKTATAGKSAAVTDLASLRAALNASSGAFTNWKRRGLSRDIALAAEKKFGCSAQWLLSGEGAAPPEPSRGAPAATPVAVAAPPTFRVSQSEWGLLDDTRDMYEEDRQDLMRIARERAERFRSQRAQLMKSIGIEGDADVESVNKIPPAPFDSKADGGTGSRLVVIVPDDAAEAEEGSATAAVKKLPVRAPAPSRRQSSPLTGTAADAKRAPPASKPRDGKK